VTTPTDVSRAHARAVLDMLTPLTELPTRYQLFFAKVDVTDAALRYPYLIVWPAPGNRQILNLGGNLSDLTTLTQVTAVGRDADEVLSALDRVAELLHGVRPTIPGRLPGFIRQVPADQPVRPTDKSRTPDGQPYYMSFALFSLTSDHAPASKGAPPSPRSPPSTSSSTAPSPRTARPRPATRSRSAPDAR
jgi:hypothetical protein